METLINNIEERYCSFEVSELLKKHGFRVPVKKNWIHNTTEPLDDEFYTRSWDSAHDFNAGDHLSCPTQAVAMEWIFINFGIFIDLCIFDSHFWIRIQKKEGKVLHNIINEPKDDFKTIGEAYNAGLSYILTTILQ